MTHIPDEAVQAMPERIWTCNETRNIWISEKQDDTTEYVRADVAVAHLSAPRAVEVRKLEWVQDEHGSIEFTAQSMFGEYSVHIERKSAYACSLDGVKYERININHPYTVDQAKAAAQADFERRILSCVVTKPVDVAALLNSAALIVEGRCTAINNEFIQKLSKRNVYEIAALVADHDIKLGAAIRALYAEPAQGEQSGRSTLAQGGDDAIA